MTLEETIKQATPLGGVYQHACPGGWTAYAGKRENGIFKVRYVKNSDPLPYREFVIRQIKTFVEGKEQ